MRSVHGICSAWLALRLRPTPPPVISMLPAPPPAVLPGTSCPSHHSRKRLLVSCPKLDFVHFFLWPMSALNLSSVAQELLKSLGEPAEKKFDGPDVLFQRHLHQPAVEKVGGREAPCIPHHAPTA